MFEKFSESNTPVLQSRACVIGRRKGTEPDSLSPLLTDALGERQETNVFPGARRGSMSLARSCGFRRARSHRRHRRRPRRHHHMSAGAPRAILLVTAPAKRHPSAGRSCIRRRPLPTASGIKTQSVCENRLFPETGRDHVVWPKLALPPGGCEAAMLSPDFSQHFSPVQRRRPRKNGGSA